MTLQLFRELAAARHQNPELANILAKFKGLPEALDPTGTRVTILPATPASALSYSQTSPRVVGSPAIAPAAAPSPHTPTAPPGVATPTAPPAAATTPASRTHPGHMTAPLTGHAELANIAAAAAAAATAAAEQQQQQQQMQQLQQQQQQQPPAGSQQDTTMADPGFQANKAARTEQDTAAPRPFRTARQTDRPTSIQSDSDGRGRPISSTPRQADRSRSVGGRLHVRPASGEIPTTPTPRRPLRSGSDSESLSVEHIPESPAELEASATRIASAFSPLETSPKL